MALAKPVIANDHPEQTQVIDASGGGLHVPWDETRFAEAMITLLRNPVLAEEMGRKGRAYVAQHRCYSAIAEHVGRAYLSILSATKAVG